jgi:hypothetical protein
MRLSGMDGMPSAVGSQPTCMIWELTTRRSRQFSDTPILALLLAGSAHYILGPFGPDTDLRRYGLRLCERGGKNAKKRAAVAVARKLAVLLHRLWVTGEVYEPLGYASSRAIVQPAA